MRCFLPIIGSVVGIWLLVDWSALNMAITQQLTAQALGWLVGWGILTAIDAVTFEMRCRQYPAPAIQVPKRRRSALHVDDTSSR